MHMQAIIYIAQFKCNNQVFMSFLPLLVCFKILIPLFSPMLPYSPNLYLSLVNHPNVNVGVPQNSWGKPISAQE